MVDEGVVGRKVAEVQARVARIRSLLPCDLGTYLSEELIQEGVTFNLVLAIQSLVDLAALAVSASGLGVPELMAETFALLARRGVLPRPLATRLGQAARMRNLLVHRYGAVDQALVHRAATDHLDDLLVASAAILEHLAPGPRVRRAPRRRPDARTRPQTRRRPGRPPG